MLACSILHHGLCSGGDAVIEYWINVYADGLGIAWSSILDAEIHSSRTRPILYRIHVRMKNVSS